MVSCTYRHNVPFSYETVHSPPPIMICSYIISVLTHDTSMYNEDHDHGKLYKDNIVPLSYSSSSSHDMSTSILIVSFIVASDEHDDHEDHDDEDEAKAMGSSVATVISAALSGAAVLVGVAFMMA